MRVSVPAELADRAWDFQRFGRGERFVYRPIPRSEFDEVLAQVEHWGLDQFLKERQFDDLIYRHCPERLPRCCVRLRSASAAHRKRA